jgi:tripartite-type tricarboxylate transporter receptor subunit TctC
MIKNTRRLWIKALLASVVACATGLAVAQDFPSRPITIIVPYAAGGSTDVSARTLAEEMSRTLRTAIVVDNKPGAAGFIAATYVAKAPKDGYTLLYANGTMTATNPSLYKTLPYKISDFAPISGVMKFPYVIDVTTSIPVKNVAEMVAYAKSKPDGVSFGTVGMGTQTHIVAEWLGQVLGFKVRPVHYKGTSQSSIDLTAGRLDFMADGLSTAATMHNAGKLRIVASMGKERPPLLPASVQTFEEAGHPELFCYADFGLLAPAGTPPAAIAKLHAAVIAALKSPSMLEKMQARGEVPMPSASPQDYGVYIKNEAARWAAILKPMNIQLD